jgi:release factor glutamine methyltransferase
MTDFDRLLAELDQRLQTLPDKPEENSDNTLRALWHCAAGQPLSAELAMTVPLPELTFETHALLAELIERRLQGVPLAHLTGRQRFMGLEMLAGPQALIPRRETELLVRTALECLQDDQAPSVVIDVCTGSANVAAAIAVARLHAKVFASDLSEEAVSLASRNLQELGLAERVTLRAGDLLGPFDEPQFQGCRLDHL